MALTDNCVAYWALDDGTGTTAADATGNGNTITLVGAPTWGTAKLASSDLSLNGSSQYGSIPASVFGAYPTSGSTTAYSCSFSVWFKTSASGVILSQADNADPLGASGNCPALYVDDSGFLRSTFFWHNDATAQIVSATTVADGNWHHLVVTYASGTETLYLDGSQIGSQSVSETGYAATYFYFLGVGLSAGWTNISTTYFSGGLDDVGVWSRALTPSEVSSLYNSGAGLQYPFSAVAGPPTVSVSSYKPAAYPEIDGGVPRYTTQELQKISNTFNQVKQALALLQDRITALGG